jgi:hypothetical protein
LCRAPGFRATGRLVDVAHATAEVTTMPRGPSITAVKAAFRILDPLEPNLRLLYDTNGLAPRREGGLRTPRRSARIETALPCEPTT